MIIYKTSAEAKLPPGEYEVNFRMEGQLLVGGFNAYGTPYPGKIDELYNFNYTLYVDDEYVIHGQGD